MDGIQTNDAGVLILFGVCGLCIVTLGVMAGVFFIFARFAGKDITSFFLELLRGDRDANNTPPPAPVAKPNFKATNPPADFDVLVNQKMMQQGQQPPYTAQTPSAGQPANAPSPFSGYPAPNAGTGAQPRSQPPKLDPAPKPRFDDPPDPFSQTYPQAPMVPPHPGDPGGDMLGGLGDDIEL